MTDISMAKKIKTTAASKAKPVKAMGASLFSLGLPFLLAAVVVALPLQFAANHLFNKSAVEQRELTAGVMATQYQAVANQYWLARQQIVDSISLSESVAQALANGPATDAIEKDMAARIPGASYVRVVSSMGDDITSDRLTFAQQDIAARALAEGKDLPAEVSFINKEQVATYVRTFTLPQEQKAVVLASFSLKPLATDFKAHNAEHGKVELVQALGKDISVVAESSSTAELAGTNHEVATKNPNWKVNVAPAAQLVGADSSKTLIMGLLLLAVLLPLGLLIAAFKRLDKVLDDEAARLDRYSDLLLTSGQRDRPTMKLGVLEALVGNVEKYASQRKDSAKRNSNTDQFGQIPLADSDLDDLLGEGAKPVARASASKIPAAKPVPKQTVQIPHEIFRAYDIRGNASSALSAEVVNLLGRAIGSEAFYKEEQTIVVGRDARLSSPELSQALIDGILSSGRDVIDVGIVPTPVLYFAVQQLGLNSGVMLTGSHNPAEDNGLKIMIAGHTLADRELLLLKERIDNQDLTNGTGGYTQQSVNSAYVNHMSDDVVLARPMRVVVDGGNGVAGNIATQVLESLGCQVTPLFCEPDGNFPNHHPDPANHDNLMDLASSVAGNEADLGIAFDGDGDRIGVVTPSGKIINIDRLMMLFAKNVLVSHPGADIIFDVKCSRDLVNVITANGGRPVMNRTGHSYLKSKLIETGAPLAGELSGHIILNDRWFAFDDAIYAAARLLEILSMESTDADAVFKEFPESVSTPELNMPMSDVKKATFMARFCQKANFDDGSVTLLDGLRVDFPDGWGLVRASNTTANIVMRFEGKDEAVINRIQQQFKQLLLSTDPELQLPF